MPTSLQIVKRFFPNVERVKDATKDITIVVTKGDIQAAHGHALDHVKCVMANACRRMLKVDGAVASRGAIYIVDDDVATRYRTPHNLSIETIVFDRGGAFAAGEYTLYKPEPRAPRGSGTRHKGNPKMGNKPPLAIKTGVRTSLSHMGS